MLYFFQVAEGNLVSDQQPSLFHDRLTHGFSIIHWDRCHTTLFEKHHKISLWYVYAHLLVINKMNNKWLSTMTKQIKQNTCKTHVKNSCHSLGQVYLVDHFLHQPAMCHGQNMGLMGYGYPHRMGRKTSLLMAS